MVNGRPNNSSNVIAGGLGAMDMGLGVYAGADCYVQSSRLRNSSPYLLQHADNPVDWYPWGDEAFARARARRQADLPVDRLLDVPLVPRDGARVVRERRPWPTCSTRDFVSIKVDREERPDVDRVYMTFVQATTGSGGWPMSVWLTPELKPFYGGTYFPPTSRWGRPGFVDILQRARAGLAQDGAAREGRCSVGATRSIGAAANAAAGGTRRRPDDRASGRRPARDGARRGRAVERECSGRRSIARHGGFGDAPKFPRPSELLFLLREHARTRRRASRSDMALDTLRAMALGGMRDHIGGGFHRYSVDAEWRVPHFEKMLYDQAQLVLAYLEAAQATGDPFYAEVAEDTLAYVLREMTDAGRRLLFGRGRRQRAARAGRSTRRAQDGRRVLHLDRRRDRASCSASDAADRARAVRHRAGRQRAARSAGRVHRQEPALHGGVDRRRRRAHRPIGRRGRGRAGRARGRRCSTRARSGRGRTSTTRCSPPGTA